MKFVTSLAFGDPKQMCALAVAAEAAGFDAIALSDHVVNPETIESTYPYTPDGGRRWELYAPWPDPWVSIGAMAAVTERIRFLTGVYVLPMRDPFSVAKAVGTAAVVSDERVVLGIGAGWMREEFDLLGQSFRNRGRRMNEMVEVLRKLWTGKLVEHHGEFYDFGPVEMNPAPEREIPIYVGGISEPAFRRAARLGDGWISDVHSTDEVRGIVSTLNRYRSEAGRGDRPFQIVAALSDAFDPDGYRRAEDAGVTHVMTMPWIFYGGATESLDQKREGIRRFGDEIVAKLA